MSNPLDDYLSDLANAVQQTYPWLEVSYREHPTAPRSRPKATVRVDLFDGLAVFFSTKRSKWTATAIIFNPETGVNDWKNTVVRKIKDDRLVLVWINDVLANTCSAIASNVPDVADDMLLLVRRLDASWAGMGV